MKIQNLQQHFTRVNKKINYIYVMILIFILILLYSIFNTIETKRKIPSLYTVQKDLGVRGDIVSKDNFKIATSKKIFIASIDTRSFNKNKQELFVKLFSIYSNMDKKTINDKINKSFKRPGYLILSNNISARDAKNLKLLGYKLGRLGVFKETTINGKNILFGLNIIESGETRLYPYKNTLTPVVGFIRGVYTNGKRRINGINGLEKSYNTELNMITNGVLKGERDSRSYIIFNKDSIIQTRKDGESIKLNIPLRLQKNIELMLDTYKEKLGAKEIIVSVMDSTTGKILSLASSNRYNPKHIRQKDISSLTISATQKVFEIGSVMKPIAISLVLDKHRVTMDELFYAYNKGKKNSKGEYKRGRIKVGKWNINDDHQFKKHYLTVKDIITYSSNIGTLQIAQRLKAQEFIDGYKSFGITKPTGIDLNYEKIGTMPTYSQLHQGENKGEDNVFKATISYGQGMTASFMQLLKAYSVFNNDGKMVTPIIVQKELTYKPIQVVSKRTANTMKRLLENVVNEGTGTNTKYDGLEIGGKTGTANVAGDNGRYKRKYMSSFFGFANDAKHKYTIGVTVNDPISTGKHWYYYYASHSAVPVFKEVINILVKLNYLKPKKDIISLQN